ncbi:MAG: hypothetical protein NE327_16925 [Lentisphaeraceae bacterium]|nr:hypothetical protein [Lentisphaeraceae bacterium]
MSQVDVNSTLDDWSTAIEKLVKAISEKNFKLFRRAYSDGCRQFRIISDLITNNEIADDVKKRILSISDRWVATAAPLDQWKEEVGEELKSVRHGNKVRSKISKAYFFSPSKTGNNLRRKAK